jgi:hypothetical protein
MRAKLDERKYGRGEGKGVKQEKWIVGSRIEDGWKESGWQERVMCGQGWMEENADGWKDGLDEHWSDALGTERIVMEICMKVRVNTVDEKRDGW